MRMYSVAITSLAIDAPAKWTDNILAQHHIPDVLLRQRGIARRIPHHALMQLAVIRELHVRLGLGVRDAVAVANQLGAVQGSEHEQTLVFGVFRLTLDRAELTRLVEQRLRDALESAPSRRRGRPARRVSLAAAE